MIPSQQYRPTTLTASLPATDKASSVATLRFRPVTLRELPLFNSILSLGSARTCDYTVGGIFMWIDYFHYEYCIIGGTLFIKGSCEGHPGMQAFSLPLGPMPLKESVGLIRDYCRQYRIDMHFSAVPEDRIDALEAVAGGKTEFINDWSDYLYDINALADLKGKAYNKKRNHVNRFISENPHYSFEALDAMNLPETQLFFAGQRLGEKADVLLAIYEREECFKVLRSLSAYPFEGAVLRDESGSIVAFTLGEVIGDTLYTHIEKADHKVAGANETINKLYADLMRERYPSLKFINREEDMGDPGLRYAKESYKPLMMLHKYNLMYCDI